MTEQELREAIHVLHYLRCGNVITERYKKCLGNLIDTIEKGLIKGTCETCKHGENHNHDDCFNCKELHDSYWEPKQ